VNCMKTRKDRVPIVDFADGNEGFNAGDVALADVDPEKLEKLAALFAGVTDRASARAALEAVFGAELVVL
jgi:hypothetical protein